MTPLCLNSRRRWSIWSRLPGVKTPRQPQSSSARSSTLGRHTWKATGSAPPGRRQRGTWHSSSQCPTHPRDHQITVLKGWGVSWFPINLPTRSTILDMVLPTQPVLLPVWSSPNLLDQHKTSLEPSWNSYQGTLTFARLCPLPPQVLAACCGRQKPRWKCESSELTGPLLLPPGHIGP